MRNLPVRRESPERLGPGCATAAAVAACYTGRVSKYLLGAMALLLAACGAGTTSSTETTPAGAGGGGGNGSGGDGGNGGGAQGPLAFKSYVVLGDSISDRGGQGPFFYDLLVANDDAKYPDFKGKDLKTRFGADLKVVKASKAGATSRGLPGQVSSLPAELPGPVLVTITIGGNDMQGAIVDILGNRDQAARDTFAQNLDAAYTELTKPDRFGAGVKVKVVEATIYDPSDGTGDFKGAGCPAPLGFMDPTPTDPFFTNWNGVVSAEIAKYPDAAALDVHASFTGHGVEHLKDGASWYAADCIHPNAPGHDQLRRVFWSAITGGA